MRRSLGLLMAVLLSCLASACGSMSAPSSDTAGSGATPPRQTTLAATAAVPVRLRPEAESHRDFNDGDDDANGDDDEMVLDYGHRAGAATERSVAATVISYYRAAVAENGAEACKLFYSVIAEEAIPESYGGSAGSGARGTPSCPVVLSKLFAQHHRQFAAELATMEVTGVRVEGEKALAILRFASTPEPRRIELHREGRAWKMWSLFDNGLP